MYKELYQPGERVFFFDGLKVKEGKVMSRSSGSQGFIEDDQGFVHLVQPSIDIEHSQGAFFSRVCSTKHLEKQNYQ